MRDSALSCFLTSLIIPYRVDLKCTGISGIWAALAPPTYTIHIQDRRVANMRDVQGDVLYLLNNMFAYAPCFEDGEDPTRFQTGPHPPSKWKSAGYRAQKS